MARRDEQGAVVPLVAVMLTVLIGLTALTVDIGLQRVARTDMQSVADMVALDLSRELDGRTADEISPTLQAAADRSVARNPDTVGDDVTVEPELGTLSPTGVFTAASGSTVPTAVRVTAATSVAFQFTSGSGGVSRSAVGVARASGCYKLGSWGARLTTAANANLVYKILAAHGIGASVSAATYQSLAGAVVDAGSLATELGLASPESLATASVTLAALLDATAQVVGTNGSSSAQVAALDTIRADLGSLGPRQVGLANIFSVASGAGSGLSAAVDLADLVIGGILVADNNSAIHVDLASGLVGVGSLDASIGITQAAKTACGFAGSTPNTSNQVVVDVSSGALVPNQSIPGSLLGGLTGLLGVTVSSPVNKPITLSVTTSAATSTLDAVSCNKVATSAKVTTSGGLLSAELVVPVEVKVNLLITSLTVNGTIRAKLTPTGNAGSVTITVPTQQYNTPYSNEGTAVALPAPQADAPTAAIGSLSIGELTTILNAVTTSVVQPLVTSINTGLLTPLSDLLGLRTSGADVLLLDRPSCTTPALRG